MLSRHVEFVPTFGGNDTAEKPIKIKFKLLGPSAFREYGFKAGKALKKEDNEGEFFALQRDFLARTIVEIINLVVDDVALKTAADLCDAPIPTEMLDEIEAAIANYHRIGEAKTKNSEKSLPQS